MSKSRRGVSRCAPKPRSKPGARKSAAPLQRTRANSKQARVLALLRPPNGARVATIMESTGWQPHSVRGSFAGGVRKRLGLKLASETSDRGRVYRIGGGGKPGVIEPDTTAAQPSGASRPRSRPRSIVSLRLDALRRQLKPAGPDHGALVQELAQARACIAEQAAEIALPAPA